MSLIYIHNQNGADIIMIHNHSRSEYLTTEKRDGEDE